MASSKVVDLGRTDAFSRVGDIFVMESRTAPPGGGGESGKSALGIMLDGTHG